VPEQTAQMYLPHFVVKQKLTMMVNRYEVSESDESGSPTRLMAVAEQKRMAFKEQVTFYSDASRSRGCCVESPISTSSRSTSTSSMPAATRSSRSIAR